MTPSAVEVLMHYHYSPEPHPRHLAPAVRDARNAFLKMGVIQPIKIKQSQVIPVEPYPGCMLFHTTDKGKRWIEAICATPCPAEPVKKVIHRVKKP